MEKHAFERQARTRKRPQAGSRVYVWWSLTETYEIYEFYVCLERLVQLKKNRKEKKDNALNCIILCQISL